MDVTGSAGRKSERVRGTQAVAATHQADVEPLEVARLDPNAVLAVGYPVSHLGVTYGSRCNGVGRIWESDGDGQRLSGEQGNGGACACGSQGVHGDSSSGQRVPACSSAASRRATATLVKSCTRRYAQNPVRFDQRAESGAIPAARQGG